MRFAVGTPAGPRSSIWRLWTSRKGDVYLGARGLTGDLKVSLHPSGKWRHAFTDEHFKRDSPLIPRDRDRAFGKWERGPEFALGYTRAFQVTVPGPDVITPRGELEGVDVHWVPRPPGEAEIYFTLILGPLQSTGWPGKNSMGTTLIHQEDLGHGERLWLVWHSEEFSPARRQALADVRAMLAAQIRATLPEHEAGRGGEVVDLSDPGMRVMAMGHEEGTGTVQDLALSVIMAVGT